MDTTANTNDGVRRHPDPDTWLDLQWDEQQGRHVWQARWPGSEPHDATDPRVVTMMTRAATAAARRNAGSGGC